MPIISALPRVAVSGLLMFTAPEQVYLPHAGHHALAQHVHKCPVGRDMLQHGKAVVVLVCDPPKLAFAMQILQEAQVLLLCLRLERSGLGSPLTPAAQTARQNL